MDSCIIMTMRIMTMRWLILLLIGLSTSPARGANGRTVLRRSKATPPPPELLSAIEGLGKLGFKPRPEHRHGWFAWTPGCDCRTFMLCWGLERSYRSQLRVAGHEHDLWAWVYDGEANAALAQENYEWLGRTHHYSVVLERRGSTVVVLEGPGKAPEESRLRGALGHALPARPPRAWLPGPTRVAASQPVRGPVTRERLLDPATPDAELPALATAYERQGSPEVQRILNQRGMRFHRTRQLARAAIAFELAIGDASTALPVYNRACVAGLQGDALRTVVWLWRLVRAPHLYGTDGTYDSSDLLRRARTDRDFTAVRRSPEFHAFAPCLEGR